MYVGTGNSTSLSHLISPKPLTRQTFLIGAFFFVLLLEVAFEETTLLSPSALLAVLNESTDGHSAAAGCITRQGTEQWQDRINIQYSRP